MSEINHMFGSSQEDLGAGRALAYYVEKYLVIYIYSCGRETLGPHSGL